MVVSVVDNSVVVSVVDSSVVVSVVASVVSVVVVSSVVVVVDAVVLLYEGRLYFLLVFDLKFFVL